MKKLRLPAHIGLKVRAAEAWRARDATARQTEDEGSFRQKLLLQEMIRSALGQHIDCDQIEVDPPQTMIQLDGLLFSVFAQGAPMLSLEQTCRQCRADSEQIEIESLADLGEALADPWVCWRCDAQESRRIAERERAKALARWDAYMGRRERERL